MNARPDPADIVALKSHRLRFLDMKHWSGRADPLCADARLEHPQSSVRGGAVEFVEAMRVRTGDRTTVHHGRDAESSAAGAEGWWSLHSVSFVPAKGAVSGCDLVRQVWGPVPVVAGAGSRITEVALRHCCKGASPGREWDGVW